MSYKLKVFFLFIFFLPVIIFSCKEKEEVYKHRTLDKLVIEKANLAGWDSLNGPDIFLIFIIKERVYSGFQYVTTNSRDNITVDSLPLVYENYGIGYELTESWKFGIYDKDSNVESQEMFQDDFNAYCKTWEENPILLSDSNWLIKLYWSER